MDTLTDNEIRITNYFDNKMDMAEQEAFLQQVRNDNLLMQQFEDELMIRSLLHTGDNISDINNDIKSSFPDNQKYSRNGNRFSRRYMSVAAVLIMIISGSIFVVLIKNKSDNIDQARSRNDTVNYMRKNEQLLANNNNITENAYKKFYRKYTSDADPVEISKYYYDYANNNYPEVINAEDSGFAIKGTSNKEEILKGYMQLYKGLCYLAENEPVDALDKFSVVMQLASKTDPQYYEAEWYSVLAWLKARNNNKSVEVLKKILQSSSPHQKDAAELLQELNLKK